MVNIVSDREVGFFKFIKKEPSKRLNREVAVMFLKGLNTSGLLGKWGLFLVFSL